MPHSLPGPLRPGAHEHGLASGDLTSFAARVDRGWELFEKVAEDADLSAPSRHKGWSAGQVIGRIGLWEFGTTLDDLVQIAHDGDAGFLDSTANDDVFLERTAHATPGEIRESIRLARAATGQWLASDTPTVWGLVRTSSPLGPLPILTVINAMTYQMAIAALDAEPAGVTAPDELLEIALLALLDTTGALGARQQATATFSAVTPSHTVAVGTTRGHWRTVVLPGDPGFKPAAIATARVIIDITSGRAPVGHLYRSGAVQVRDLGALVRLAPVLEGVPGLPPLGTVGRALHMMESVGGLVGRFRRR